MNAAKAIRDKEVIKKLLQSLEVKPRFHLLVRIALETGLRICDILALQVKHVKGKDEIVVYEKKTKKTNEVAFNDTLSEYIQGYIENMKDDDYLFHAQGRHKDRPMTRAAAHRMLIRAARKVGYNEQISFHSLRKAYGLFFYDKTKDLNLIQQAYNHSTASITSIYLKLDRDYLIEQKKAFKII